MKNGIIGYKPIHRGITIPEFKECLAESGLTLEEFERLKHSYEAKVLRRIPEGNYVCAVTVGKVKLRLEFSPDVLGTGLHRGSRFRWFPSEDGTVSQENIIDATKFDKSLPCLRRNLRDLTHKHNSDNMQAFLEQKLAGCYSIPLEFGSFYN